MPYTIGYFVYGVDLATPIYTSDPKEKELRDTIESFLGKDSNSYNKDKEFINRTYQCEYDYFGISEFGVDEIDEAESHTASKLLKQMKACERHKKEYKEMLKAFLKNENVPDILKEYVKNKKPEVFLCWGTS